jgi:hypothetical protein
VSATLTTTAHNSIIVLVNLDRTFCGSDSGGVEGVGLRIDQPRLDIPGDDGMNGEVMVLG